MEKRIVFINKKIAGGKLINPGNLRYDLEQAKYSKNIFRKQAHITRGIMVGHAFENGNKRTTAHILIEDFGKAGFKCNEEVLSRGLQKLSSSKNNSIPLIENRLRKWFKKA